MKTNFKSPAFISNTIIFIIGFLLLIIQSSSLWGSLFIITFTLLPILINMFFALALNSKRSQIILSIGSVIYSIWFSLVYLSAFYWHIDAKSEIAILFVGIYSLPVMVPIWILAHILNKKKTNPKV